MKYNLWYKLFITSTVNVIRLCRLGLAYSRPLIKYFNVVFMKLWFVFLDLCYITIAYNA